LLAQVFFQSNFLRQDRALGKQSSMFDLDGRRQIVQIEYEFGLGSQTIMMLPVLRCGMNWYGSDSRAGGRQRLAFRPAPLDCGNRAQAFSAPHNLSAKNARARIAYVLNINDIMGNNFIADRNALPRVKIGRVGRKEFKIDRQQ
jgi:hypothetical protein